MILQILIKISKVKFVTKIEHLELYRIILNLPN